jgi:copper chaperone CopZ
MAETSSKEYILGVGGMTCNNCVNHVETALSNIDGVLDVEVNLEEAKATVNSESTIEKKILEEAVTNAGYSIHEPGTDLGLLQLDSVPKETEFNWSDGAVWKQSAHNTKWCLIGCSIGDFGTIAAFQFIPYLDALGWSTMSIMLLAMFNGIMTSIALETFILLKQMPLNEAFRVAVGMSLISMISMEAAMNIVDVLLTGGAKLTPEVIVPMLIAGFITPWPYNYWRLKKYGQACH